MAYLNLTSTGPVERGGHDIHDTTDGNGDKEPRQDDGDQEDGADDTRKSVQEHAE